MVITSYDAEAAVVQGDVAQEYLDHFEGSGLVGLSLAVGGLRRPVSSTHPCSDRRTGGSKGRGHRRVAEGTVHRPRGHHDGHLDLDPAHLEEGVTALELDMGTYHNNLLAQRAPYITSNVVLWPKMWALVVNADRFNEPHRRAAGLGARCRDDGHGRLGEPVPRRVVAGAGRV